MRLLRWAEEVAAWALSAVFLPLVFCVFMAYLLAESVASDRGDERELRRRGRAGILTGGTYYGARRFYRDGD